MKFLCHARHLLALCFLAATAISTHASVLLYEDFSSYDNGSLNGDTSSSLNTTGAWLSAADTFGSFTIDDSRLNFARTAASGVNVPKYARVQMDANAATMANSSEFWGYGVIDAGNTGGAFFSVSLFADATPLKPAPFVNNLVFGAIGGKGFIATNSDRHSNSSTSVGFSNQTLAADTLSSGAHTFLVRLVNQGTTNDTFQLWIDADLSAGMASLGTPDAEITVGNMLFESGSHLYENTNYNLNGVDYSRSEVRYSFLANANSSGWMDDFRLGTTFDDIANIPEPGVASLTLMGFGFLFCRRQRKDPVSSALRS